MNDQKIFVLAEKPDSARKIARALSMNGEDFSKSNEVIDLPRGFDGVHYVICSAVGHLYELIDSHQRRELFPVLDIDWYPRNSRSKCKTHGTFFSKGNGMALKRIGQIARVVSECSTLVNACDYDPEGETIGFNTLVFASPAGKPRPEILRAKFSTLTTEEIRDAFRELRAFDKGLAVAGRTRHLTDFLWGVNLSRALTVASHSNGNNIFTNVTIGRVQGPTLAFVVERELLRRSHVPVPSWRVSCLLTKSGKTIAARYIESPIKRQARAMEVHKAASAARQATVKKVEKDMLSIPPRYPFDLGELQREAYRLFKLSPKVTLSVAQKLYQDALISYPRTESQKLPERIGPSNILAELSSISKFSDLISQLRSDPKTRLRPREGPWDDPAHPAIHPTGEDPKSKLFAVEWKLFDLIVRRFCNVFAPNEIVERTRVTFDISSFDFAADGTVIVDKGWTAYYPFVRDIDESFNSFFAEGEKVPVVSASMIEEYEPMPRRLSEGSLLTLMEVERVGTKATRAETIATLIERKYVEKIGLELLPTCLGQDIIENVKVICPGMVSTKMTRDLEEKLELIRSGKESEIEFVSEMLSFFRLVMKSMRHRAIELEDVESLSIRGQKSERNLSLGSCPSCGQGELQLIRSPKTKKRFIRCTNFEKGCRTSSPAYPRGRFLPTKTVCSSCGWPIVSLMYGARSATKECSNFNCTSMGNRS